MAPVILYPYCGCPEVNSNTLPILAMANTEEARRRTPLGIGPRIGVLGDFGLLRESLGDW